MTSSNASSPASPSSPVSLGPRPSHPTEKLSKNLKEQLEKERLQNGLFENVIADVTKAHKWNLGFEKINFQAIYHAKYLYDDNTDLISQDDASPQNLTCIKFSPIPKGFYEQEMYDFFTQIAPIRRMRINREPKNGLVVPGPKSYALIDFKDPQSAAMICEEIPMLNVRGQLVRIEMFAGRRERMEKFFTELTPEEYAAQILKNSAAQGETWSVRRRRVIPALAYSANRLLPAFAAYRNNKTAEEREMRLNERLAKHQLSYKYEPIDVDTENAAAPQKSTTKTAAAPAKVAAPVKSTPAKSAPSKSAPPKGETAKDSKKNTDGKKRKRENTEEGRTKKRRKSKGAKQQ